MRDKIVWKPSKMATKEHGRKLVYVKHWFVPFVGLLAARDTAFTVPAFIRINNKRVHGFITPSDGMAFQQEHKGVWFVAFKRDDNANT